MIDCDYCGRGNEPGQLHCRECVTLLPSPQIAEDTPPSAEPPDLRLLNPSSLDGVFVFKEGFHRADWSAMERFIAANVNPEDQLAAWNEAVLFWISKVRADLGGCYSLFESEQTVLLCNQPVQTARWILDYAGRTAVTIREILGPTAWRGWAGRNVLLIFSDEDDYYQYLAFHTPEGEQAKSGGVCIHSGYTHVALPWYGETDTANTIVHELTHDCLAHLPLPPWLNEGVAVTIQKAVAPPARSVGQSDGSVIFDAAINWRAPIM